MSTKTEAAPTSPLDAIKWILVVALVVVAVGGNAYYGDEPLLYRVIAVVVLGGLAAVIASFTEKGRSFLGLLQDARSEVRRVVWPTKQETAQTTGIVVLVVAFMALLLWGLDWALGSLMSAIIG